MPTSTLTIPAPSASGIHSNIGSGAVLTFYLLAQLWKTTTIKIIPMTKPAATHLYFYNYTFIQKIFLAPSVYIFYKLQGASPSMPCGNTPCGVTHFSIDIDLDCLNILILSSDTSEYKPNST